MGRAFVALSLTAAALTLGAAPSVLAAVTGAAAQPPGPTSAQTLPFSPQLFDANRLIGMVVQDPKGEDLGQVQDVVLRLDESRIAYVVLSYGGIVPGAGKYFAIPWSALRVKPDGTALVLNATRRELQQAPGFPWNQWPDVANPAWAGTVGRYWQEHAPGPPPETYAPAPGQGPGGSFWARRLSELIGVTVVDPRGRTLGEIDDLIIDLREGRVAYAQLLLASTHNEMMADVPWSAITVEPRTGTARLDATEQQLRQVAFVPGKGPDLTRSAVAMRLHRLFGQEPYWEVFGYTAPSPQWAPGAAWQGDSIYNSYYDPRTVVDVSGVVVGVGSFTPPGATTQNDGLRLRLRTADGNTFTVYAGPKEYAALQGMHFYYGDQVEVNGSMTEVGWRPVIMAAEVRKGYQTLLLRNSDGWPVWQAEMLYQRHVEHPAPTLEFHGPF